MGIMVEIRSALEDGVITRPPYNLSLTANQLRFYSKDRTTLQSVEESRETQ